MKYLSLILLLTAFGCKSPKISKAPAKPVSSAVDWENNPSLYAALDLAAERGQLLFVDLYTDWCLPCKMMDKDVFSDRKLGDYLNDNFVCYKVNAEKGNGPDLAMVYEVKVYPTLLWLDPKGKVILRKEGSAYHSDMYRLSKEALANNPSL